MCKPPNHHHGPYLKVEIPENQHWYFWFKFTKYESDITVFNTLRFVASDLFALGHNKFNVLISKFPFRQFYLPQSSYEKVSQTLVYLISGLGTGEGTRWRDAMSAAGSFFTSPGSSTLLEVIASLEDAGWVFFCRFAITTLESFLCL